LKIFEELGVPVSDDKCFTPPTNPPDMARIVDVSKKHGVIYVPELQKENYGKYQRKLPEVRMLRRLVPVYRGWSCNNYPNIFLGLMQVYLL
jgi:hypothetical protein